MNERHRIGYPRKMLLAGGDSLGRAAALLGEKLPFQLGRSHASPFLPSPKRSESRLNLSAEDFSKWPVSAQVFAEPVQRGGARFFEPRRVWIEVAALNQRESLRLQCALVRGQRQIGDRDGVLQRHDHQ